MESKKDKLNLSRKSNNNILNIYRLKDSMKRSIDNKKCNKYIEDNNNRKKKTVLAFNKFIIHKNISNYNSNPTIKNIMIINNIIKSKENHYIAIFKDQLINDNNVEFFHRFYDMKECAERIGRLYSYYKNYLLYFCKPTFSNFEINSLIQEYGQNKAEEYYTKKYNKMENKNNKDGKENSSKNAELLKSIFTNSIKKEIEKMKYDNLCIIKSNSCNKIKNNKLINNNFHDRNNNYKINESIQPSTIVQTNDSNNSLTLINTKENTILNIIKNMNESKINKNIFKKNIKNNPIKKYLQTLNQINHKSTNSFNDKRNNYNTTKIKKMNFYSIKKYNEFINSKESENKNRITDGPMTSRIQNTSKIKNKKSNNFIPNNFHKYNSQKKIFNTKNHTLENWKIRNYDNHIVIKQNEKNKMASNELFFLSNNNLNNDNNHLYSLSNTNKYKNLKINTDLLSNIKKNRNNLVKYNHNNILIKNKKLYKNLGLIIQSLKSTASPKNTNNDRSLSSTNVNKFNININNQFAKSNQISPRYKSENNIIDNGKKIFKNNTRNSHKNILKIKTEINDYINYSNSNYSNSNFKSFKKKGKEINRFLIHNYNSLNHQISPFHQKTYSLKALTLTSKNLSKNKNGKNLYSLKCINNNHNNNDKKIIISDYKYK